MTYIIRYEKLVTVDGEGDIILWVIDNFKDLQKERGDSLVSKIKCNNEINIMLTFGHDSKVNVWKIKNKIKEISI